MAEEKKGAREKVKVGGKGSPDGWASEQERERLRRSEGENGVENRERERARERVNNGVVKKQNGVAREKNGVARRKEEHRVVKAKKVVRRRPRVSEGETEGKVKRRERKRERERERRERERKKDAVVGEESGRSLEGWASKQGKQGEERANNARNKGRKNEVKIGEGEKEKGGSGGDTD